MAFISLGEALDRVLEKLAVEREEKGAGGVETAGQLTREGRSRPARDGQGSALMAKPRKAKNGRVMMAKMK